MLKRDLTVIYYSANKENEDFEARIRRRLWRTIRNKRIRLISVTQKPTDFGENIVVGEVGYSAQNAWRQFQIGAKMAKTRFVCPTEADYIYPSEYFDFQPEREDTFYLAHPLWVLFAQRGVRRVFYRKPRGSEAAMMVGTQTLVDRLEVILGGRGYWGTLDADGLRLPYLFNRRHVRTGSFELPAPIVTFKTDRQLHRRTPLDPASKVYEIPGFGTARDIVRAYTGR